MKTPSAEVPTEAIPPPTPIATGFFFRMVAFAVGAVLVPALGLQMHGLYQSFKEAEERASARVSLQAKAGAARTAELLRQGELLLTVLANRPEAKAMTANACPVLFQGVKDLSPVIINVIFSDAKGRRICSLMVAPGQAAPRVEDSDWFSKALEADSFVLSEPRKGQTSGRDISLLTLPIRNDQNLKVGVLALSLDLLELSNYLQLEAPLPRQSSALITSSSRVMARHPLSREFLGQSLPSDVIAQRMQEPEGVLVYQGLDKVPRLIASSRVPQYALRFSASVPFEDVFAESKSALTLNAIGSLAVLALAFLASLFAARGLISPMRQLVSQVRKVGSGTLSSVSTVLPGEFHLLAAEFNQMLALRTQHSRAIADAATKAQRQASVYQALSATNRAIVRAQRDNDIYSEVCSICVNFGHATIAWIAVSRDGKATPVAWAGTALEYTQGLELDLSAWSPDSSSPAVTAIREGQLVVINDFLNDPRTLRWRDRAAPFGIRSSAAVPIRRAGKVMGVLSLQMNVENHFDAPLTALLQEMAGDLSFALDNIDRDRARAEAESRIKRHEQQLSGIVETAMDAIITVDARGRVVVFNRAASRIFGIAADEAMGLPLSTFIPKRLHTAHAKHLETFVKTGSTSRQMDLNNELTAVRVDGTEFPIEASISKLGEGENVLATVVLRDVTHIREAKEQRQAQVEAEAANRAKTQFLSRMSHELRTPLNAILGFSKLLQSSMSEAADLRAQKHLSHIVAAGGHLRALIDDVLDLSRIEAGALTLTLQNTPVVPLLSEVLDVAALTFPEAGVSVDRCYLSEVSNVTLITDSVRLKQVLTNIISNAFKYNRKGGRVAVALRQEVAQVTIEVSDTGLGMGPEQLAQLYQPFNRLGKERSDIEGTGIGLVLSRELTELLGGQLTIHSELGVGTTVLLAFPQAMLREPVPEGTRPEAEREQTPSLEQVAQQGLSATVCYIEDNPVNAQLVQELLARLPGVRVLVAATGREGVQLVQERRPNVVLLDMQLPDMPGLEVLRELKQDPVTRDIPVIALSASAMSAQVNAATFAGVRAYWTKPLNFDRFVEDLQAVLAPSSPAAH